jgi:hypothetical protein
VPAYTYIVRINDVVPVAVQRDDVAMKDVLNKRRRTLRQAYDGKQNNAEQCAETGYHGLRILTPKIARTKERERAKVLFRNTKYRYALRVLLSYRAVSAAPKVSLPCQHLKTHVDVVESRPELPMISTTDLSALQPIDKLKKLTKSLAVLDAIIQRDWEYRYYSFNSKWSADEQMASMRNGQGDEWFCTFGPLGAFLKGFDHESLMSPWRNEPKKVWPGVLDSVPEAFRSSLREPAFSMNDTTFCIWRTHVDTRWHTGKISYPPEAEDPDGSAWMLAILDGNPNTYKEWAEGYYEQSVSLPAIIHIYEHKILSPEIVRELNPAIEFSSVLDDVATIDYPIR